MTPSWLLPCGLDGSRPLGICSLAALKTQKFLRGEYLITVIEREGAVGLCHPVVQKVAIVCVTVESCPRDAFFKLIFWTQVTYRRLSRHVHYFGPKGGRWEILTRKLSDTKHLKSTLLFELWHIWC